MRIRGIGRIQQVARRLWRRFESKALILVYHRVVELPSPDPYLLGVTSQHSSEHLQTLRKYGQPMQLQQLVGVLRDGSLPRQAIIVTFDDGYADNLYHARPLLERYDIPATVFVTAGYIEQEREFWWDELERLLLQPGTLPEKLHVNVDGSSYEWNLGEVARYRQEEYEHHRHWNYGKDDKPTLRHHIFLSLYRLLRFLPEGKRQKVLKELEVWAGTKPTVRRTHRALLRDEVIHLVDGKLIEVGCHTMTHPILSSLPQLDQWNEIQGSKKHLEKLLERPVSSFAYPHGSRSDYTPETVAIVREAGFTCACSNSADIICRSSDPFELPRMQVEDWDSDELDRRLKEWFGG